MKVKLAKKVTAIAKIALVVFLFLVSRLVQLQIVEGRHFVGLSRINSVRRLGQPAPRGRIVDTNGVVLADSRPTSAITILPLGYKHNYSSAYRSLESTLNLKKGTIKNLAYQQALTPSKPTYLLTDAPASTVSWVEERKNRLPGVTVVDIPVRLYPFGSLASHLLGFVRENKGTSEYSGRSGLELLEDSKLAGNDGGLQVLVDNRGQPVRLLNSMTPEQGNDISTTIDFKVQRIAEASLEEKLTSMQSLGLGRHGGAVVVMDVDDGSILSMVSKPDFDPNMLVNSQVSSEYFAQLAKDGLSPFTNRCVQGTYPLGSAFKPFVAVAALESQNVSVKDKYTCWGYDPVFHSKKCWIATEGRFHGIQTLAQGIQHSCNIVFYEMGRKTGIGELSRWARIFGFGQPIGYTSGTFGAKGLVPDPVWKEKALGQRWYPIETLDFSIGQGFFNVTPIQVARAYASLVNGGWLVTPHVLGNQRVRKKLPIQESTFDAIRKGMELVTQPGGTAGVAFSGINFMVGGKTGSAQNPRGQSHAWFVGYAPAYRPKIVVVVLVENAGAGGTIAAPIARRILEEWNKDQEVLTTTSVHSRNW